jgi:hypothetical protein
MRFLSKCYWTILTVCLFFVSGLAQNSLPDLSALNSEDRASIEASCVSTKYVDGPAAYHDCLRKYLKALSGSQLPDLSALNSEDRASIEASCVSTKYVDGPAAYHDCLQNQLRRLSGSSPQLGSKDEAANPSTISPTVPLLHSAPTTAGPCAENGSCYGDPNANGVAKTVHVKGYYRKDGTYVRGHYRSAPGTNPPKQ